MKIVWYPYFGLWLNGGRYWFRFTIRIKNFFRRYYVGRDRFIIQ